MLSHWKTLRETELDPLQKIVSVIHSGKLREFHKDPDLKSYKLIATEMSVTNGVILHGNKIVMPESIQQQIIKLSHEGHQGIVRSKYVCAIESVVSRDQQEIEGKVKNCIACEAASSKHEIKRTTENH